MFLKIISKKTRRPEAASYVQYGCSLWQSIHKKCTQPFRLIELVNASVISVDKATLPRPLKPEVDWKETAILVVDSLVITLQLHEIFFPPSLR